MATKKLLFFDFGSESGAARFFTPYHRRGFLRIFDERSPLIVRCAELFYPKLTPPFAWRGPFGRCATPL